MKKILIVISFIILILSLPATGETQPKGSYEESVSLIQKALELSNRGKYEEAIPYAKKALEIAEQVLDKNHPDVAAVLNHLAVFYRMTGRYVDAEPLYEKSLEIREKTLGKDHPDVGISLNSLAELYRDTGRYSEAEPLYKRSLEIYEKALGKDHPDVALGLNNLASLYQTTGRYAEAEPLYKKSLEIYEKALGKDSPEVATILSNLGLLYQATGRYAEAEPLHKRSLDIRKRALGKDHIHIGTSLNNLALLYQASGRYSEAEPLHKKALEIYEKTSGRNNPAVATIVNNLALLYQATGRYVEAEPLYKRALEIKEKVLGKDHSNVAASLNNLAVFYYHNGRYAEAEPLYKRALEIKEKALGKDHPDVALGLNNLASLYKTTGRYVEAKPLYKRALEIKEKALGKDHPDVALGLNNLASLYQTTGRYAEAEPLYKKSLEIYEKPLGKDHPDVGTNLNDLAILYQIIRRYAEAEPLYKRSLEIYEKAFGKDHPNVAASVNNLASLYQATGRYVEAEPLYKRALEIEEKVLGKDHPNVGSGLNNLALLYEATGRYVEAELLYKRALEINEKALGKDHPDVGIILENIAILYTVTYKNIDGHMAFARANGILDKNRDTVFLMLSEKQKLNYMSQTNGHIHRFISHTAEYMQLDNEAAKVTFDAWLRWKGSVMEAQGRYIDAITYSDNPEIRKRFEELNNIRREIAKLQLSKPEKMSTEDYRKRIAELEKRKDSLEVELSRLSKGFDLEKMVGKADTKSISEILLKKGMDSVYIDFGQINVYDFKEKKFGNPRYLVFVLIPDKEPMVKLLDLSDVGEVDSHIKAYLEEMKRSKEYGELPRERTLKAEAKAIYERVIKPIESYIKGKKHLYVSPDGNLNLIPFEVLMTPEGKYLMEDYSITYVTAGRDIVRFTDEKVAKGDPVIMADPDYDMGLEEKTQIAKAIGIIETRGPAPLSRDAKDLRFRRLPDTKKEANAVEKILRESYKTNVRNYQDKKALEEVLMTAKEPRILHLSTHGYFLKDEELKKEPQMMGFISPERYRFVDIGIENPMLRSGIALAGANASLKEGRDDGVVSAEKILGLRLKGTELVVLSACETGTGDVKSGEGVFGLKRSFILSGAKTVVMSLWSIPSKETTELMTDFYTLMAQGKSKSEALREARLNLMKKKPNPFYWGAFIMVGNPN